MRPLLLVHIAYIKDLTRHATSPARTVDPTRDSFASRHFDGATGQAGRFPLLTVVHSRWSRGDVAGLREFAVFYEN